MPKDDLQFFMDALSNIIILIADIRESKEFKRHVVPYRQSIGALHDRRHLTQREYQILVQLLDIAEKL